MITERLAEFDRRKRVSAAILVAGAAALACYYTISRPSLVRLQEAKAEYARARTARAHAEMQRVRLRQARQELAAEKARLAELQQKCFRRTEAVQFFENTSTKAVARRVGLVSRFVADPKGVSAGKATERQPPALAVQSAQIAVAGDYGGIVDLLNELTDCRQKVCLTNLHITLPSMEMSNPRATFTVAVLIDSFEDTADQ